jgi:hypothetical protein
MNHDTSISEMIDKEDEQRLGLLGKDPEIQFIRLAADYADMKLKLENRYTHIEVAQWLAYYGDGYRTLTLTEWVAAQRAKAKTDG